MIGDVGLGALSRRFARRGAEKISRVADDASRLGVVLLMFLSAGRGVVDVDVVVAHGPPHGSRSGWCLGGHIEDGDGDGDGDGQRLVGSLQ